MFELLLHADALVPFERRNEFLLHVPAEPATSGCSSHSLHPNLAFTGSSTHPFNPSGQTPDTAAVEDVMTNREVVESGETRGTSLSNVGAPADADGLPRRLLTTYEVAEFVGCHEETVRRAYQRGLLVSQRFGVRSRRFHPADVLDWIRRGAPTRVS